MESSVYATFSVQILSRIVTTGVAMAATTFAPQAGGMAGAMAATVTTEVGAAASVGSAVAVGGTAVAVAGSGVGAAGVKNCPRKRTIAATAITTSAATPPIIRPSRLDPGAFTGLLSATFCFAATSFSARASSVADG